MFSKECLFTFLHHLIVICVQENSEKHQLEMRVLRDECDKLRQQLLDKGVDVSASEVTEWNSWT